MSTVRDRLATAPALSMQPLTLQSPPVVERPKPKSLASRLLPAVMVIAMVGMVAIMFRSGSFSNPMTLMFPIMMVVSVVGMLANSLGGGDKTSELNEQRKDYLRHLSQARSHLRECHQQQREMVLWSFPAPAQLPYWIDSERLWEKTSSTEDFGAVRLGEGRQESLCEITYPQLGLGEDIEPVSLLAFHRFVHTHTHVSHIPVAIDLRQISALLLEGTQENIFTFLNALLVNSTVFHSPYSLSISVVGQQDSERLSWLKWLPHHYQHAQIDHSSSTMLFNENITSLREHNPARFSPTDCPALHLIVCTDHLTELPDVSGLPEKCVILSTHSDIPPHTLTDSLVVTCGDHDMRISTGDETTEITLTADSVRSEAAEQLARHMAAHTPLQPETTQLARDTATSIHQLWNLDEAGVHTLCTADKEPEHHLHVPLGVDEHGQIVHLDIKEAALSGVGPHGLCVGATGSGKSEFLRTLVCGMIARHHTDDLNLILVDFKGGATFLDIATAPHISAVITNLEEETHLVDRMKAAIEGEITRRQHLLREAGNLANIGQYTQCRRDNPHLPPLPSLMIIIDEFSELLAAREEFIDVFVAIGRIGRSLGIHMLLATQRIDTGKLRGLDSHLSYKICLKTFSASESRDIMGSDAAYKLPATPGAGYLVGAAEEPVRFMAEYVSGEYTTTTPTTVALKPHHILTTPTAFRHTQATSHANPPHHQAPTRTRSTGISLLHHIVSQTVDRYPAAHQLWLEPLPKLITLATALSGGHHRSPSSHPDLRAPIAVVDIPEGQRREIMEIQLGGASNNLAIIGGRQSGKSWTMAALLLSLAASNPPTALTIFGIDCSDGSLHQCHELPHVANIVKCQDVDKVDRLLEFISRTLQLRENATGVQPHIIIAIDSWSVFTSRHEHHVPLISHWAATGAHLGLHIICSANRWLDLSHSLRENFPESIELRVSDPHDSQHPPAIARTVPANSPGRFITTSTHQHAQILAPLLGAAGHEWIPTGSDEPTQLARILALSAESTSQSTNTISHTAQLLAKYFHRTHPTQRAAAMPQLPATLHTRQLAVHTTTRDDAIVAAAIGLHQADLTIAYTDFARNPTHLIVGKGGSGKTSLLAHLITSITTASSDTSAKLVIADYRRNLHELCPAKHLAGYASHAHTLEPMLTQLCEKLSSRLPQENVANTWEGPDIYLIIDDYDLITSTNPALFTQLSTLVPFAEDIGLHIVVARRSEGFARAAFEPLLTALRATNTEAILFSAHPAEGEIIHDTTGRELPVGHALVARRGEKAAVIKVAEHTL